MPLLLKRKLTCLRLLIGLALLFNIGVSAAKEQRVGLSSSVGAGSSHTTRLNNLPKGAALSIRVDASAELTVLLIDQDDFKAFPAIKKPVFQSHTSNNTLKFEVRVPESDNYYLVLGNPARMKSAEFTIAITASTNKTGEVTRKLSNAHLELEKFEKNLREFFLFDELEFRIAHCGTANAFSGNDTITVCTDIAPKIINTANDEQMARDVMVFVVMHEVGHILLRQWGYPFYDNEEVVDEFSTTLLVMFNQGDRARAQAEYFKKMSPDKEYERKRSADERHPFSVQRSRNIIRWLDDPELVKRWQKILVPHMQTPVLKALLLNPKEWTDRNLLERELSLRSD